MLQQVNVSETMVKDVPTVTADMKLSKLASRIAKGDPLVTSHQALPIVNFEGKLAGIITRADILRALEQDPAGDMAVIDVASTALIVTYPDELLYDAAAKMLRNGVGRLPAVIREDPTRLVGYL